MVFFFSSIWVFHTQLKLTKETIKTLLSFVLFKNNWINLVQGGATEKRRTGKQIPNGFGVEEGKATLSIPG